VKDMAKPTLLLWPTKLNQSLDRSGNARAGNQEDKGRWRNQRPSNSVPLLQLAASERTSNSNSNYGFVMHALATSSHYKNHAIHRLSCLRSGMLSN
jgi:hypothetical protein